MYVYIYINMYMYIYIYEYHIYRQIPLYTHDYLTNSIRNVGVATDEGPSPKLAPTEGRSRGNIEN